MSTSKTHRRVHEEKNRKGRLTERSSSYAGIPMAMSPHAELRRPKTLPNLLSGRSVSGLSPPEGAPRLTKLLLNVTVQRSLGPVQVVMSPDSTVEDLIAAALRQYAKEGRRLAMPTTDPAGFDLHYSQFSLESLDRNEKLMKLGSRNFFLCCRKTETESAADDGTGNGKASSSTCSKEAEKGSKISVPWLKFIETLF